MITAYKKSTGELEITELAEPHNWINLINPTKENIEKVSQMTGALSEFLEAPLDPEERPRIDTEDDQILIIMNVPIEAEEGENQIIYDTIPLGMIIVEDHFITVCLEEADCLQDFIERPVRSMSTLKKTRFILQIFYKMAIYYLKYLKQITRKTLEIERSLHRATKNEHLIKMIGLEKSLVYFTTSLKSNEIVMKKIFRTDLLPMYEEDDELLEDALTEMNQAIDTTEINSNILSGLMDAYASLISNNLNVIMKILASLTIILTIPTMIYSFFGMNVPMPGESFPWMGPIILVASILVTLGTYVLLKKKNMF